MSFSEWKEIKLGELLNFRRGHDLPKTKMLDGNIPVVGSNGVIGFHNEITTKAPCLTIGRSGNIGNPCYINKDCWAHNTSLYVDDFKGNDPKYLYYLLKTLNLGHYGGGSAVPTLNRNHIHPIEIKATINTAEQKAIAHILSTLDDKIEVNNQINKTLENMAQAIFKQWFVDFEFPNEDGEPYKSSGGEMVESELGMIPKGWEVKELGEIIDIIKQGTKPGEHLKDRKYNPIDTLPMKSIAINDFKPYEEAKSSLILFEKYDILIGAMRVYFHRVNLAPYKGITRTTTFVLRSKRIQDVPYNLFLLNMDETIDYAERTSKGSTMPYAVWDNGMSNMLTAYSNKELRNNFFEIIQPMLETIMKRSAENEVLIKLRDSILPKLMSGKIRVPLDSEGDVS
ncbi:restriction endonuclease subunit S [Enterococcus faecium]|uniref:restriction endonuclease subunit S n=1 Tax=Enterococcus sp. HMSC067C01 TaxID=1739370 RepID=UPI0008A300E8|nr:restriction endonuclease subunit S [Enterococcus sp. HMSC067C01]EGP5551712.1 restriction endonuclease subunit S [Enterococcus faecium]EIY5795791.1 restriction endonuclease subunit S [Enterococcus faecium]EME7126666.1 restriction endonuclease subunit S [Enterococcus faecium]OFR87820.1 hypothetical protein HMPREF2866_03830 [Enterococcus sp. HMSC067C01]